MNNRVTVTTKENFIPYDDGSFELKDPSIIGHLTKIHTIQIHQVDPETKNLQTGVVMKGEVYWEHNRSLETVLCDVIDLVWLSFSEEGLEEDDASENEEDGDDADNEELENEENY